jgi:hypothetical protein
LDKFVIFAGNKKTGDLKLKEDTTIREFSGDPRKSEKGKAVSD